jgi:hypothetical protein
MRQTARRQGKLTRLRRRLTRRAAPAAMARGSELDDHAGEQAAGTGSVSVLRQVHMSVAHGSLVGVVGAVASGKTSLLLGMLGELPRTAGSVEVRAMSSGPLSALMNQEAWKASDCMRSNQSAAFPVQSMCHGKVAYAAQMPWLTKGTVRDNIVFGEPFDRVRCALPSTRPPYVIVTFGSCLLANSGGLCPPRPAPTCWIGTSACSMPARCGRIWRRSPAAT